MAVWSSWTATHSSSPSTCVFCRNQPPTPVLPGVFGPHLDLRQIVKGRQRRLLVAHGRQSHRHLIEVARPDGLVAGRGFRGVHRVAPGVGQAGDQGAGVGAVLLHLQHQGRGVGQLAAVCRLLGDARQFGQGGDIVFPTHALVLAVEAGQNLFQAGGERSVRRRARLGLALAEADDEVPRDLGALAHPGQGAGHHGVAGLIAGRGVGPVQLAVLQIGQPVRGADEADAGLFERLAGLQEQMGVALPGVEAVARDLAPVIDAGIGDVRLQHQIGRHLALQRRDGDAQHQGVAIRVAEDLLLDLEAAVLVAGGDAIGGRQRAPLRVHVQIFGAAGGVRAFDDQAVMGDAGEAQGLDLGLVDQAVHGLGQDAVGDGIPDLGHRPGRAAIAILAIDIGFVGGARAGLGRAGPDGRRAGRAGGDARLGGRCGSEGQAGGAGEAEGTEVTHCGPHGLRVGAGERRKVKGASRRWFHDASACWAPGKTRLWKSPGP